MLAFFAARHFSGKGGGGGGGGGAGKEMRETQIRDTKASGVVSAQTDSFTTDWQGNEGDSN